MYGSYFISFVHNTIPEKVEVARNIYNYNKNATLISIQQLSRPWFLTGEERVSNAYCVIKNTKKMESEDPVLSFELQFNSDGFPSKKIWYNQFGEITEYREFEYVK
jgi:hypothetical protein